MAEKKYWMWRCTDPSAADSYAVVSLDPDGSYTIGYDENYYRLSPEQFMLGDYHSVF